MRSRPCTRHAWRPRPRLNEPKRRTWILAAICGCLAALALPGAALADSMALAIAPEPVANLTSLVSYTASSEEGTLAVVAVNNPSVPCAADPEADQGRTLTPSHIFDPGQFGTFSGSLNYTPATPGAYTLCGWLEIPAGLIETDGGPVTASASLPIDVRGPRISLALSFPRHPVPRRTFTLHLVATTEATREVVVEAMPLTRRGCPVNYAAEEEDRLIDQTITGGPWTLTSNVAPLRPGNYVFCAFADPLEDDGLNPEATAKLVLRLGQPAHHTHKTSGSRRSRR
jgi:hypothetical protein